jgi:hypothetical protein
MKETKAYQDLIKRVSKQVFYPVKSEEFYVKSPTGQIYKVSAEQQIAFVAKGFSVYYKNKK